ncbi:Glycosyltransferase involved in cell wall bisynthesis [Microbacterium sp. cf046]|uniref:glycosyltransferase n=1 Tax=Microbacterium sp. cf046 TaxID=1761803 RepID=UPI0008F03DEC|nr:glycosyltransferase [Microbacterium sp. cf046]SFR95767.1 Glycosyltransferase involved in cell wall bisynthesis [Microbacterium sp. cf046]
MTAHPGAGFGAIALAAYRPDPVLFARQLTSIQRQSVGDFVCIISSDGEPERVRKLVAEVTGGDPRFTVIGHEHRVGFYANFERALRAVPDDAEWVALSDQDDLWNPDKLERLLPLLQDHMIVSGQARVVEFPSGRVIEPSTHRRDSDLLALVAVNQFSGAMSVFRRAVLDLAMPFPAMPTRVEVHDHWIAVCSAMLGGTAVVGDVLQDYVQHGGNVLGEVADQSGRVRPASAVRTLLAAGRRYEGSSSPIALLRALYDMGYGWRAQMTATLSARITPATAPLSRLQRVFGRATRPAYALSYLTRGSIHGTSNAIMLAAGRILHPWLGRRLPPTQ